MTHDILPPIEPPAVPGRAGLGLGGVALAGLLNREAASGAPTNPFKGILDKPHLAPKAKRIIYLFMAGGPSQLDLFDHKPLLNEMNGQDLPDSVRMGQRLTGMSGNQATLPLAGSIFKFAKHGKSGAPVSELLPYTAKMVDELCFVKSCYTEAINHDPAITFFQTGHQLAGRPSMGSWLSYGLGSANENLPAFVVLISKDRIEQPLYARLWGNGFLPSMHQGVQFRSGKDPVLYLDEPRRRRRAESRRKMLDRLAELHALQAEDEGDPEIARPRRAVRDGLPHADERAGGDGPVARSREDVSTCTAPRRRQPGTFAANCLLARRLAERDVRFIQLYHPGWDHHGSLPARHPPAGEGRRPGLLRPDHRPEAARPARRHAGRLGRRVRPDELLPGQADRDRLRPRPPPALLHDVVRRRRA